MLAARQLAEAGELPLPPHTADGGGGAGGAGGPDAAGGGCGVCGSLPALPPCVDRGVAAVHGLVLRAACCPLPGLRVRLELPGMVAAAAAAPADGAHHDR